MKNGEPPSREEVSGLTEGLRRVAYNLWWTWHQEAQEVFEALSPRAWRYLHHNAVAVLQEVSEEELSVRLRDPEFAQQVRHVVADLDSYLGEKKTWGRQHAAALQVNPVAYFTAEFGFHETLPIAAGGLGILAGDHTKSASDLGIGFVGISLFYREGFFQQAINHENWQTEYYSLLKPESLPLEPVLDRNGAPLLCNVEIALNTVVFQVWRARVGRCSVYLLDTNRPENEERLRDLTLRVYGGDSTTRIMQEILLGIGGVRLLRELGINPSVFHMNEGHSAFLVLELIREKMAAGRTFKEALSETRSECLFTTHTPVEAGHDRFSADLVSYSLGKHQKQLGLSLSDLMALGRVNPNKENETFCMTVLALKVSRAANAVSELHGQVSRRMWQALYPTTEIENVPIGHITNGIHLVGWMKGPLRQFLKRKLGPDWDRDINSQEFWQRLMDPEFITDDELWILRYQLRREFIEYARRRLLNQVHPFAPRDFIAFERLLNPDALTIGFARRFATYKRAPLVFRDFEQILAIVSNPNRPVQFVFSGKAHPRDDEGKTFIQQVIHLSKNTSLKGHVVFIENYDVSVARQMVSGCDVWLNNPRRPLEASGTSGQKVSAHGGLNLSILDGWWREGYDGTNGFAIGDDSHPDSVEAQDQIDSDNLYRVLTEEVVPCFYDRDELGLPRKWIHKVRRAMSTLVPTFNTWRMVQEYTNRYYLNDGDS